MPDSRVQSAIDHWAPRFVQGGVDFNDFQRTVAGIERWEDWLDAWIAEGLDAVILKYLHLPASESRMQPWEELVDRIKNPADDLTIRLAPERSDVGALGIGALELPHLVAVGVEHQELVGPRVLRVAAVKDVRELLRAVHERDLELDPEYVRPDRAERIGPDRLVLSPEQAPASQQ